MLLIQALFCRVHARNVNDFGYVDGEYGLAVSISFLLLVAGIIKYVVLADESYSEPILVIVGRQLLSIHFLSLNELWGLGEVILLARPRVWK